MEEQELHLRSSESLPSLERPELERCARACVRARVRAHAFSAHAFSWVVSS